MLFIKSTFRKKTSKIYIILLSILMTVIFILLEFNHYFENETQNSYDKNAFYLMYSKEDLENDLLKYEEIKNVKTGIFLEFENCNSITDCWRKPGFDDEKMIPIFPSYYSRENTNLQNNEIVIPFFVWDKPYDTHIGKIINTFSTKNNYSFEIKQYYKAMQYEYYISNSLFEKIKDEKDNIYIYKIFTKNFRNFNNDFYDLQNAFNGRFMYFDGWGYDLPNYYLDQIKLAIVVLSLLFIILIFIILKNFNKDNKNMHITMKKIGYSKLQIYYFYLLKTMTIIFFSIILSFVFQTALIYFLNSLYSLNLQFLNLLEYLIAFIILYVLSIFSYSNKSSK